MLAAPAAADSVLTGAGAYGDWTQAAPGVQRLIRPADLPPPDPSSSRASHPAVIRRPSDAWPAVPPGFAVTVFAGGLNGAREMRRAPNGDIILAQASAGRISVIRSVPGGREPEVSVFATGLDEPFGLALYPPGPDPRFLYVGTEDAVLRIPYRSGDAKATGAAETIVPRLPEGGHRTRNLAVSPDGRKLFIAVGSLSNDGEGGMIVETHRADILEANPDGSALRVFASGLRNPVGLGFHPATGALWAAVNERDGFGDNLPPDYVTTIADGGFYGWPWYYIGPNRDPEHAGEEPPRRDPTVPDVLIQPHSAPIGLAFYDGEQFPAEYKGDLFVALHGSWNRSKRTGYKLIRIHLVNGKASGAYEDFMTGFVASASSVWGRPTGVAVAADGALLVSDDASGTIWRIAYVGSGAKP
jgi:glucose/arabinose dehydrogenase